MDQEAKTADRGGGGGQGSAGDGGQVGLLTFAGVGFAAGQGEQGLDEVFLLGVGGESSAAACFVTCSMAAIITLLLSATLPVGVPEMWGEKWGWSTGRVTCQKSS